MVRITSQSSHRATVLLAVLGLTILNLPNHGWAQAGGGGGSGGGGGGSGGASAAAGSAGTAGSAGQAGSAGRAAPAGRAGGAGTAGSAGTAQGPQGSGAPPSTRENGGAATQPGPGIGSRPGVGVGGQPGALGGGGQPGAGTGTQPGIAPGANRGFNPNLDNEFQPEFVPDSQPNTGMDGTQPAMRPNANLNRSGLGFGSQQPGTNQYGYPGYQQGGGWQPNYGEMGPPEFDQYGNPLPREPMSVPRYRYRYGTAGEFQTGRMTLREPYQPPDSAGRGNTRYDAQNLNRYGRPDYRVDRYRRFGGRSDAPQYYGGQPGPYGRSNSPQYYGGQPGPYPQRYYGEYDDQYNSLDPQQAAELNRRNFDNRDGATRMNYGYQRAYRPSLNQSPPARPFLGVTLDPRYSDAAIVTEIHPNSAAQRAGLRQGDTIWEVNGMRVYSPDDLAAAISRLTPGDRLQLRFDRPQSFVVETAIGE